uniref:NAD(P)-binding domain-containing protein n=1 Tax=Moniliophthora roreri TaxID=221103 RepID=A0A0W0GFM7_MONRR
MAQNCRLLGIRCSSNPTLHNAFSRNWTSTREFPSLEAYATTSPAPLTRTLKVTGATGFIGSHIVSQLLEKNIKIRAVVRFTSKVKTIFPDAGSRLEIVEVPSLLDDHTEALKGVSAVIHTAVPGFRGSTMGAYEGILNIINQAISLGIKKITVTGSYLNLFDTDLKQAYGDKVITEKDFGSIELADIKPQEQDGFFVYSAAKTVTDKRLLQIARENPDVDVTVRDPSFNGFRSSRSKLPLFLRYHSDRD